MEAKNGKEGGGGLEGAETRKPERDGENQVTTTGLTRKEKRKLMKRLKRKQIRREIAEKEREEEEKRLNDPEEQERLKAMEEEEARTREKDLKEFEEREREWLRAMELKKKMAKEREEEEKRRRDQEESQRQQVMDPNGSEEDGEWEYVEEGPAEIIFQGNEIIFRKKKVRISKKDGKHAGEKEDAYRPTSNPLPPESEAFADYQNAASAQQALENTARQVPNFGTEQDKAHCPFHLKTGVCRFGHRCSRVHFYPDMSCTLLIKNMYNGPGLAWEQDEGLEFTDEEIDSAYEEFYEDVHSEFLKFGEIVNFKVCRNGSFHLRGNVYVHYKSLESAVVAYQSVNGRYFAGKQVKCEFVSVTRWKAAICGEYMKSRLKTCSHGTACNFIHCFRNPGGDYEWADWDKPPPKYWVENMAALFGYSDGYLKQKECKNVAVGTLKKNKRRDSHWRRSRRSKSRDDNTSSGPGSSIRSWEMRHNRYEDHGHRESHCHSDDSRSENDTRRVERDYTRKAAGHKSKWTKHSFHYKGSQKRTQDMDTDSFSSDSDGGRKSRRDRAEKSTRHHGARKEEDDENRLDRIKVKKNHHGRLRGSRGSPDYRDMKKRTRNTNSVAEWADSDTSEEDRQHRHKRKGSRDSQRLRSPDDHTNSEKNNVYDSGGECFDGEVEKNRHRQHKRKGSWHHGEISEQESDGHERKTKNHDKSQDGRHRDRDKRGRHHKQDSSGHHRTTPDVHSNPRYTHDTDYHGWNSDGERHNDGRKHLRDETLDINGDHMHRRVGRYGDSYSSYDDDDGKIYKPEEDDRWRPASSD